GTAPTPVARAVADAAAIRTTKSTAQRPSLRSGGVPGLRSALLRDEHRHVRMLHDPAGDATEHRPREGAVPARAHHDQVGPGVVREAEDLVDRVPLEHLSASIEPGLVRP